MSGRSWRLVGALCLTLIVVALRVVFPMPSDGWLFLLIAPIAIVAVDYSVAGGVIATALATALVLIFKAAGVGYSITGVFTRIAAFAIAGAGVAFLVEQRKRRDAIVEELQRRDAEHRAGLQLNDEVVQGIAVAKMAIELGDTERAIASLEGTLQHARSIASRRLDAGGRLRPVPGGSTDEV